MNDSIVAGSGSEIQAPSRKITFADFPADYSDQINAAAHAIVASGLPVVALIPGTKRPAFKADKDKGESRLSTLDHAVVDKWWPKGVPPKETRGLGILTDGLAVFDVDVKTFPDGINPHAAELEFLLTDAPIRVCTPRGGNGGHTPFRCNDGRSTKIKKGDKGIDIIASKASLVVAPPTWLITTEDHPGGAYTYREGSKTYGEVRVDELPFLPAELDGILESWAHKVKAKPGRPAKECPPPKWADVGELEAYIVDRCEKYIRKIPHHIEKASGHKKIYHTACVIAGDYGLRGGEGFQLLQAWNAVSDHPDSGESQAHLERTWRSALLATEGKPQPLRWQCYREFTKDWNRSKPRAISSPVGGSVEAGEPDGRTLVVIREGQEAVAADQIMEALADHRVPLFRRDGQSIAIFDGVPMEGKPDDLWSAPQERARAGTPPDGWVHKRISETCDTRKARINRRTGEEEYTATNVPPKLVEIIVKSPDRLPPLNGLVFGPVVEPDGRLMNENGYDSESGFYFTSPVKGLEIPENPTLEDARAAERELWDVVRDFPWADPEVDYPRWLSLLFTQALRYKLKQVPLGLITGPAAGAGKTTLSWMIGYLLHGVSPISQSWTDCSDRGGEERMGAQLVNLIHAGEALAVLDNVPSGTEMRSAELNQFLTCEKFQKRTHHQNKGENSGGEQKCQLLANGNNVIPASDLIQRTLIVRFRPTGESHRGKEFRFDAKAHVTQNRTRLLAAILTIVRAYRLAGSPQPKGDNWGSFEGWVAGPVALTRWLTGTDPIKGIAREWVEVDPETVAREKVLLAWHDLFGDAAMLTTEVYNRCWGTPSIVLDERASTFREAFGELINQVGKGWGKNNRPPNSWDFAMGIKIIDGAVIKIDGRNYSIKSAINSKRGKGRQYRLEVFCENHPEPTHHTHHQGVFGKYQPRENKKIINSKEGKKALLPINYLNSPLIGISPKRAEMGSMGG
jgi:hypothetical protein